jgi:hypothetical protein
VSNSPDPFSFKEHIALPQLLLFPFLSCGFLFAMNRHAIRGALAFGLPILLVFALTVLYAYTTGKASGYFFLAAGPLCGIAGGLAFRRKAGLPLVLGLCFGTMGLMFSLQDARSAWFSDIVWTGLVSAFMFWVAGACAVLVLPARMRFNGAMAFAIPGLFAGMAFQFLYGPAHFLFNFDVQKWWGNVPWEHFVLWLIAGAGGGWLFGSEWARSEEQSGLDSAYKRSNNWAAGSMACVFVGFAVGAIYFLRSRLPLGLFNSLSPIAAATDWLWGWGVLAASIGFIGLAKPAGRKTAWIAVATALVLVIASFRLQADPWKTKFNSSYAQRLLRENPQSGDAIYTGNLILAQAALDRSDMDGAKQHLLAAAATPGARVIQQTGLDVTVARALFDRGDRDTVMEYLQRGRALWPQGTPIINRWIAAIRGGRRPNFNARNPNPQQQQQQ